MQWIDHPENQSGNSIPKKHYRPNRPNTYIEHSLQQWQNRYFYQAGREYFFRTDHKLCNKTSLSKLRKTEITPNIFFDYRAWN